MMVLCILLAMLSLFLSLKLIYQRKLVQKVKKQIDFLIDRDTQTEIMVEKTDGTIQDLAASINHLLKKYRSMGQEIERSDTLFRDTITSLSHTFKGVYGQPIGTYMKVYRMKQAAALLRQTQATIAEIASQVGYENQSKFATAFRDVMKIAPAEYRKQNSGD